VSSKRIWYVQNLLETLIFDQYSGYGHLRPKFAASTFVYCSLNKDIGDQSTRVSQQLHIFMEEKGISV